MRLLSALLLVTSLAVADAASDCDKSFIKGIQDDEIEYVPATKILKCKEPKPVIEYSAGPSTQYYTVLKCASPWKPFPGTSGPIMDPAVMKQQDLNIRCVAKPACHFSHIVNFKPATMNINHLSHKLACNTLPSHALLYEVNGGKKISDHLTCELGFWNDDKGAATPLTENDDFKAACVVKACHDALISRDATVQKDASGELTCPGSQQLEITANEKYDDLKCDVNSGWTTGSAATPINRPATDAFVVTCVAAPVQGCDLLSPTVANRVPAAAPNSFIVDCGSKSIIHDGKRVDPGKLTCTAPEGWKKDGVLVDNPTNPLSVTCAEACKNIKRADGNGGTEEGLSADVDDTTTANIWKCRVVLYDGTKNAIKLNDKLVHSHLHCTEQDGWHSVNVKGVKKDTLLDAFGEAKIECGDIKVECLAVNKITSQAFTQSASELIKEEYECDDTANENYRPTDSTDDPNILKCKPLHTMFDISTKTFYKDSGATCTDDSVMQNRKWYMFDEDKKESIEVQGNHLVCLRKRCNKCETLIPISQQADEKFVDTPGKVDECAFVTCADDLWKVKLLSTDAQAKQYAGKVTCSAKAATSGKWLIDDETPIQEASCIPPAQRTAISCKEAAPLKTACDPPTADCVVIDPDDDNPKECPDSKKMFYKQKGAEHFEEGAFKISCEKTKGIWTITKEEGDDDVLKRGGSIVCADKNPNAKPTPPACEQCKEKSPFTMKCKACSEKESDLQFVDNDSKDVCTVSSYGNNKIETEKAGEIANVFCNKTDLKWRDEKGKEVGKFAANNGTKKDDDSDHMMAIIGGTVGAVLLLLVVFVVIFKVFVAKKKPVDEKEEETKRKMLEEARKNKKKKAGDNDEILDEIAVDAPSEIKL